MDGLSFVLMFLVFPLVALQYLLITTRRKKKALPPGPYGLPIVGSIFQLRDKPHKSLAKLADIHGPLMSLRLGRLTVVVVSSASMAKEVLGKNNASLGTRPVVDAMRAHRHHESSVLCLPIASRWKTLRKICNTQVFSSGRLDGSQHLRQRKVEDLLRYVRGRCRDGVAVEIGQVAFTTTLNFLSNTFFSIDVADYGSEACRDLKQLIWAMSVLNGKPNIADFFPGLTKLDPLRIRQRMEILLSQMMDIFGAVMDQRLHESLGDSEARKDRDVLDALLKIVREKSEDLEHSNILHFFLDLIAAGTETTSGMVEWTMSELLRHPDKLRRLKAEILLVLGKEKTFEEAEISRLPYFQAVIKEIARLHPASPLLPRQADSEIEICGFRLPKNSQIWINLHAIGRDPKVWANPNSFEPERFLESEIDVKGRDFKLIPFGAGRRICPGLPLAIRMVPLIVGSLIHSFDWELENGVDAQSLDMDDRLGTTSLRVQPLRIIPICVYN